MSRKVTKIMAKLKLSCINKTKSALLPGDYRALAGRVCRACLDCEPDSAEKSEVAVTIVDDSEIRELNREYRGIDSATDVLSFEMGEENPETGAVMLGDIIISIDSAVHQSQEYEHSLERELAFLTIHGMLHLLGYDHMTEEEEKVMFAKQDEILERLKLTR